MSDEPLEEVRVANRYNELYNSAGSRQPEPVVTHRKRQTVTQRRAQKKVRFAEVEERRIDQYIRESEALAGFSRFHHRYEPLAVIAATSAGIRGWSRYERSEQLKTTPDPVVVSSSVSDRVEPEVHQLIRASSGDGDLLPEAEGGQHLGGSAEKEKECRGCCGFSGEKRFDFHVSEFNYSQRTKDSNCLSSAAEAHNDGWMELEVTVDSGACDTVMPISSCDFKILPSYASTHGMEYEVANGAEIPNLGERKCLIRTPGNRKERRITFQVADVHKPLLSVTRAADAGFDCLLTDTGGHLIPRGDWNNQDTWIPITRKGNLYTMRCWVKNDDSLSVAPFGRQR